MNAAVSEYLSDFQVLPKPGDEVQTDQDTVGPGQTKKFETLAIEFLKNGAKKTLAVEHAIEDQDPLWYKGIVRKVLSLLNLQENWDSYGSKPISLTAIKNAFKVITNIVNPDTPMPYIVPSPSGAVQIEWHTNGIDLEIEVSEKNIANIFYENVSANLEEEWESNLLSDLERLRETVAKL